MLYTDRERERERAKKKEGEKNESCLKEEIKVWEF